MALEIGAAVPDCTLLRPDGTPVKLSEFRARALVVIFLRHLAWIACRAHLGEVAKQYEEIRRLGGEVVAVSFSKPERVAAFLGVHPLPFAALADPRLEAYRAFDLGRTSWRAIFAPRIVVRFVRMILGGWLPTRPGQGDDVLQLGGDFVLDASLRLTFAYRSADPTDRPSIDTLVQAVRAAVEAVAANKSV